MNDIDRLEARLTSLETGPYLYMVAASKLDALAARVEALEKKFVTTEAKLSDEAIGMYMRSLSEKETDAPVVVASQRGQLGVVSAEEGSSGFSPAPAAPPTPLVERICLIFHKQQSPTYPARCEMAKEAILVAAEELLGDLTIEEHRALDYGWEEARVNAVLRARLARAKEAAK